MGNRIAVDTAHNGRVLKIEEILSDGSKVYSIRLTQDSSEERHFDTVEIDCINEDAADKLLTLLGEESDYIIP